MSGLYTVAPDSGALFSLSPIALVSSLERRRRRAAANDDVTLETSRPVIRSVNSNVLDEQKYFTFVPFR